MSSPQDESLFDLAQGLGLPDLPENIEDEECVSLIECQESNTLSALENSSTVSNEAAHQLDLIDQFDLGETNIMFKEYNDTDEEPEAVNAIHSDVELPDLATFDIPEKQPTATEDKGERDSIPNVLCDGVTVKMEIAEPPEPLEAEIEQTFKGTPSVEQSLPDVIDIVESIKSAIPDHPNEWTTKTQEENVPSLMVKEVDNSTCPATDTQPAVGSTDNLKDEQIRLLRETLQSISNLLTESIGVDKCEIPNELNDTSVTELVSHAASLIAQLNEKATQTATSTSPLSTQTGLSTMKNTTSNLLATTTAVTKGETNDATATATATKETLLTSEEEEWVEVREENHPAPDYGLESPVISHLLTTWTTDTSKIEFLRSWVRSLYMPSYEHLNYPPGLQITNLSNVLKDGFMVLLVPLIRTLSKPKVVVHVKRHLASQLSPSSIQHNHQNQHQQQLSVPAHNHSEGTGRSVSHDSTDVSSHLSTDPFANDILYDIRIKRLDVTLGAESGLPGATEGGYMIDHTAARQFFRKNSQSRVDTQYYSPLSEINSALPAIEEQTKRRIFDHAPDSKTIPSVPSSRPHPYRSSPPSTGPRYKSFDAGPRLKSYERDYVSAETGTTWEPSASFSVASGSDAGAGYVVPAAAPSILQSIYTWWGAAPLPTPALLSENEENTASVASEAPSTVATAFSASAVASLPVETVSDKVAAGGISTPVASGQLSGSSSTASIASATDNTESTTSKTATSSATASPARAPVNKIAERLQKIRDQKQPQT